MKVELSFRQLWFNETILNFLFRTQAKETLEELVNRVGHSEQQIDELEDSIEDTYDDWDDFEEVCYNSSVDEILSELGYDDEE